MLLRRPLALSTIFCLLIGLLAVPRGPILVCRITGTPMIPVVAPAGRTGDTCCAVTVTVSPAAAAPRFALSAPGCCELRQDQSRAPVPAVPTDSPETPVLALLPASPALPLPRYIAVPEATHRVGASAPRAPPLRSAPPRAPPVFS